MWSNNSTSQTIIPSVSGQYWVKVLNQFNCAKSDTIKLTILPLPQIYLGNDTAFCEGTKFILNAGDFTYYLWSNNSTSQTIEIQSTGNYYVKVSDSHNCSNADTVSINVVPNPQIQSIDTTINSQIVIYANNGTQPYQYSINSIDYQYNSAFSNLQPNQYVLTVRDANNCLATTKVSIPDHKIIIPNFFTPNSDGIHDTWEIKGIQAYSKATIQIFDRFGKLLIEYNGSQKGWNGYYNGSPIKSDDYWYLINLNDGQPIYKGHVTIKR